MQKWIEIDEYNQKSMKNQPKIDQKSIKNLSKNHQKSTKNRSWRGLGASWGLLGPLGVSWRSPAAPRGRPGGVLAASWRVLGASWWATWLQLDPQNRAKIDKKSRQKTIKILMLLGIGILSDFLKFLVPTSSQVGSKMVSKIDVDFEGQKPTKR